MSNTSTTLTPPTSIAPTIAPPFHEDLGYSAGTSFCLLFFFTCFVYFGGGIVIRKFIRGAEGPEIIPHYEFWNDLPNLIRDGIAFTLNGCEPELTYERI